MMFNNLLNTALSIIPKQKFLYKKYISTRINDIGIKEDLYDVPIEVEGSVQAVQKSMYQQFGLDFTKSYIKILCSLDIRNFDKNRVYANSEHNLFDHNQTQTSADKVVWHGKEYLVENVTDWYVQDGWKRIIAVEQQENNNKC